jgi:NAD(P)-dependent dehydrogenase (short-subunit alcohol dehydrogenase family)
MAALDGKVALVTGSGRGLGEGIARALAAEGATVICADVLDAAPVADSLPENCGGKSYAVHLDVTDRDAAAAVASEAIERLGAIDILVNNAGIASPLAEVSEVPPGDFERAFGINVIGIANLAAAVVPGMKERRWGRIVNTSSHLGKAGWPNWGPYCASKFAVVGLTQCMALELAPYDITVNAICPGTMVAPMMRYGFEEEAKAAGRDVDEMIAEKAAALPLGRMGTPEDMGAMVAWVASDAAAFTTGASLNVSGGEAVYF